MADHGPVTSPRGCDQADADPLRDQVVRPDESLQAGQTPLGGAELAAVLAGARLPPPVLDRAGRVKLLLELADALLTNRMPSRASALFMGGALQGWLESGGRCGSLERTYLRVVGPPRSRLTPGRLAARCARTATPHVDGDTLLPPEDEE